MGPSEKSPESLARALRQALEGWQLAGITHTPRIQVPPEAASLAGPEDGPRRGATRARSAATPRAAGSSKAVPPQRPSAALAPPVTSPAAGQSPVPAPPARVIEAPVAEPGPSLAPAASAMGGETSRAARLEILQQEVRECRRCEVLARTRTQTVFGVGDPHARIVFIGEAPGADEDAKGEPFVGRAGQLLDRIIEASQLRRNEVYICNILKCRPPENRTPEPQECANCRPFLNGQLAIIDPEYIVCWGAVAAQNLLNVVQSIGKLRGRFHQWGRAKVLCTYHPSYLLRNPPAKKDVWNDMKFLMADMGITLE